MREHTPQGPEQSGSPHVSTLLNYIASKVGAHTDHVRYSASTQDHPRRHQASPRWRGGAVPAVKRMR